MSTTLFFLVPIGMLAVVWSLCFVGACLPTSGLPGPNYSNTILKELSLIAYWPLSDFPNSLPPAGAPPLPPPPQGSTGLGTALDLTGKNHNGSYINPPIYQSGTTFLTTMGNPPVDLKPTLNLRQTSMLPGDAVVTGSKNLPACVDFEGGYVSIPWVAGSPPLTEFTLEAWIKPRWTIMNFNWVVFAARTKNGTGFVIYINQQNQWQFDIGNGTAITTVNTMLPAPINPSATTYVALTFKSTSGTTGTLSLWIDPDGDDTSVPPTANFTTQTTYVAVDSTQPMTFFIGAGDNQNAQTPRTQDGGPGAPLVPFQGLIQSVALYNSALQPTDLASHFADGAGSDT
ncbi:MAG: LamG-like jellyroll fold domain-containing protein [Xanthobacteraceae bacterium]